jgi:hypothetical protein
MSFRFHVFSARPCYDFLSPERLPTATQELMSSEKYGKLDGEKGHTVGGLKFEQLGRRSRDPKLIQQKDLPDRWLKPHRFWSEYLSMVAHPDYRGPWFGFAPYRVRLDLPEQGGLDKPKLLHVTKVFFDDAIAKYKGVDRITAFPKAYLTPLGWTSAVSFELASKPGKSFPLDAALALAYRMRKDTAYSIRGGPASDLQSALIALHRTIRNALLGPGKPTLQEVNIHEYIVASPVDFDGQQIFDGNSELDVAAVLHMLDAKGQVPADRRLITLDLRFAVVTAFNRGSFLVVRGISTGTSEERQPARCALSNFKNALMMAAIMQRYHQSAPAHPAAQQMRQE